MGNSASDISGAAADPHAEEMDQFDGIETLGYRVLGVQPNSPASKAGLVSFFDFILGANEKMLLGSGEGLEEGDEYDDIDFPALLQENKGQVLELLVWNIKAQEKRLVELTPNDDWGGAGLLGVTIKLDNYGGADERLIRVLDVEMDSPASIAGLVPLQDFLLGTTVMAFADTAGLSAVLRYHVDQVVELYVYNAESDVVRVVALMPTLSWGGHGLLGAEVGTGYLHRLPTTCRGTIGQSVERKVRIRKSASDINAATTNAVETGEGVEEEGANIELPEPPQPLLGADATKAEPTLVEMEPHLEMERSDSSSNIPGGTTKQPYQLGSPVKAQQEQGAGTSSAESATPQLTSDDAASLFAGPPPPSSVEQVGVAPQTESVSAPSTYGQTGIEMLPPPPKMSART